MPQLKVTYNGRCHLVSKTRPVITIGREANSDLYFRKKTVSSTHGCIVMKNQKFYYEDTSTNGTIVESAGKDPVHVKNDQKVELQGKGKIRPHAQEAEVIFCVEFTEKELKKSETGRFLLDDKRYHAALQFFEQKIEIEPENIENLYFSYFAALNLNQFETAVSRIEQYLTHRPFDTATMLDLAIEYEKNGLMEQAEEWYRQVISTENVAPVPVPGVKEKAREMLGELPGFSDNLGSLSTGETVDIPAEEDPDIKNTNFFSISYDPRHHKELIDKKQIGYLFDQAYKTVGRVLNFYPRPKIQVLLVSLDNKIQGKTDRRRILLNIDRSSLQDSLSLEVLVNHEYVHFCLECFKSRGQIIPWWIHEGFAQFVSQKITPNRLLSISRETDLSCLFSLRSLERYTAKPDDPTLKLAYLQAHVAFDYLINTQGQEIMISIIRALGKNECLDTAFRTAGISYEKFEKDVKNKFTQLLKEPV